MKVLMTTTLTIDGGRVNLITKNVLSEEQFLRGYNAFVRNAQKPFTDAMALDAVRRGRRITDHVVEGDRSVLVTFSKHIEAPDPIRETLKSVLAVATLGMGSDDWPASFKEAKRLLNATTRG